MNFNPYHVHLLIMISTIYLGYSGPSCTTSNPCQLRNVDCGSHGRCVNQGDMPNCVCDPGMSSFVFSFSHFNQGLICWHTFIQPSAVYGNNCICHQYWKFLIKILCMMMMIKGLFVSLHKNLCETISKRWDKTVNYFVHCLFTDWEGSRCERRVSYHT